MPPQTPDVHGTTGEPGAEPVVVAREASYRYPPRHRLARLLRHQGPPALDDVCFTIDAGSAVGLLGGDGAGKTTLLGLVSGILAPTHGSVRTFGRDAAVPGDATASRVGMMAQGRSGIWPDLTVEESLRVVARAHQLDDSHFLRRRSDLVEEFELAAFVTRPAGELSAAERVRAVLASVLVHEPGLVVLDEPGAGLDQAARDRLRDDLLRVHGSGTTMLLAARSLGEIESVCDRVLVLDAGRLVFAGEVADMLVRADVERVLVVELVESDLRLDDVPGTRLVSVEDGGRRQRLAFVPGRVTNAQVLSEVAARAGIRRLTLEEPDLAELVSRLRK